MFVDTPGFQTKHRSRLNDRMNRAVTQCLADVDATLVVVEAGRTTEADRAVIRLLPAGMPRALVALNKVDRLKRSGRAVAADGGARRALSVLGASFR